MKEKILYGGDYNPEQWLDNPEILDKDIELMKEAKINCVTLGMFSWSMLEPNEGEYNFIWLENIIKKLDENNISIILGTPSGAKPNWLGKKYEEVRVVRKDGVRELQGNRHNFCTNSPIYREKIKIIDEKLAHLSLKHKNIILWHISNEFGMECHCELCQKKFQRWLEDKYKNIDNLNYEWWTTFWSHRYNSFEEINTPMTIGEMSITALNINYKQFMTQNFIDFYNFEKETIKKINPNILFTTNYHGTGNNDINYREFSKYVDIISYDSYPEWMIRDNIKVAYETSFLFDLMRSTDLEKKFLLMESSPTSTNWQEYSKLKPPKLLELASLQAISQGSASVLYFQIRQSRGSAEKFHGAVIGHDGSNKSRVYQECKKLGEILTGLDYSQEKINSKVAIYYSWLNKYALAFSQGPRNKGMDYYKNVLKIYKVLKSFGINIDIVYDDSKLDGYELLIIPMGYMLEEELAKEIKKFVNSGKTLVTIAPCAYVNSDDLCHLGGFPGHIKEVLGIEINEIDALLENEVNKIKYKDKIYQSSYFCELINLKEAISLADYQEFFYKGTPAITKNCYGAGKAYHIGTLLEEKGFETIFEEILKEVGINPNTDNKNILYNEYQGKKYIFNFSNKEERVKVNGKNYLLEPISYLIIEA